MSSYAAGLLERFQAKACPGLDPGWIPVRVKKTRQNKKIEPRSDSIGTEKALGLVFRRKMPENRREKECHHEIRRHYRRVHRHRLGCREIAARARLSRLWQRAQA